MGILQADRFELFCNPNVTRAAPYPEEGRAEVLSEDGFRRARQEIGSWEGFARTPLHSLPGLAKALAVGQISYKDEGGRFGLGSFKALGGAYAVFRLVQKEVHRRRGVEATAAEIMSGRYAELTSGLTVTCATDGNHGRSVAWGAQKFGCRCVIYVHATVSAERCRAIESYGATVKRVQGNYDDSVRRANIDAQSKGWHVVSDTSYEGYTDVPRDVMQGYTVMVGEALDQLARAPTHVFIQGGVGGLAAAVCSHLWQRYGSARPILVVVEPDKADCLLQSARKGERVPVGGSLDTIMAGLACGEVSLLAWKILRPGADAFMSISDAAAEEVMRILADSPFGDGAVVAGESAVAGLAAMVIAAGNDAARADLSLGRDSTILVFGTEGATDAEVYERIVGRPVDEVRLAEQIAGEQLR